MPPSLLSHLPLTPVRIPPPSACPPPVLQDGDKKIDVRVGKDGQPFVENASWHSVPTAEHASSLVEAASRRRVTADNGLNERSSRSHLVILYQVVSGIQDANHIGQVRCRPTCSQAALPALKPPYLLSSLPTCSQAALPTCSQAASSSSSPPLPLLLSCPLTPNGRPIRPPLTDPALAPLTAPPPSIPPHSSLSSTSPALSAFPAPKPLVAFR